MTEDSDEYPEPDTEIWSCMGVRRSSKGKRCIAWRMADGETVYFVGRSLEITGGRYEVMVTRRTDGDEVTISRHGMPRYTGRRDPDDELVQQWRAEEVAAQARLSRERLERKHAREDPLDALIDPLVEAAGKLRTSADRDAFLAHVIRRIQRTAW